MYILNSLLFPNPIIPFTPLFLTIIFSSLAYIVLINIYPVKNKLSAYIAAPLFIGHPVLYYSLHFSTLNYAIGIGFFFTTIGSYFYIHGSRTQKLTSLLFFSYAISLYQSFLLVIISILLIHTLISMIKKDNYGTPKILLEISKHITVITLSLFIYLIVWKLFLAYYDLKIQYINNFVNFTFSVEYALNLLDKISTSIIQHYRGSEKIYGQSIYTLSLATIIPSIIITVKSYSLNSSPIKTLSVLIMLFGIICTPFLLNLSNAGTMPTRSLLAIPIISSLLMYLGWEYGNKAIRIILLIIVTIITLRFSTVNNHFTFINQLNHEADKLLAIRIESRTAHLLTSIEKKYYLEIIGTPIERPSDIFKQYQTIGSSFFSHNGGNMHRIILFMRTLGISHFKATPTKQRKRLMDQIKNLPTWPHKESVAMINNIIVVKLGNYSYQQKLRLCSSNLDIHTIECDN